MGNPALGDKKFMNLEAGSGTMTLGGVAAKSMILLGVLLATATYTWTQTIGKLQALEVEVVEDAGKLARLGAVPPGVMPYIWIGLIAGFVIAIITIFNPKISPFTSPVYAGFEGLAIGGLSAMFEYMYPGIGLQAAACTLGTFFVMVIAYAVLGLNQKFAAGVVAATGGICLAYIGLLVARMFGCDMPLLSGTGPLSIGISFVICAVAAFNLLLDFDTIERGVSQKAPKYMEWYCAFSLLVTIVWLYLEILRIIAKLRSK